MNFSTYIKCFDNGGRSLDRYTVVALGSFDGMYHECVSISDNPLSAQGVCQFGTCKLGEHLGKQVPFKELPKDVQTAVKYRVKFQ